MRHHDWQYHQGAISDATTLTISLGGRRAISIALTMILMTLLFHRFECETSPAIDVPCTIIRARTLVSICVSSTPPHLTLAIRLLIIYYANTSSTAFDSRWWYGYATLWAWYRCWLLVYIDAFHAILIKRGLIHWQLVWHGRLCIDAFRRLIDWWFMIRRLILI